MKTPKASKSRATDPQANLATVGLLPASRSPQMPLKVSLEHLRDPASKLSLRQHFTGAFPETHRVASFDSSESSDMGVRDRLSRTTSTLTVGQIEAAGSSTSSVNSAGGHSKRLSTLPESNKQMDIEQAINLLQELRKTASPQDLVALHKALLPTRDSIARSPSIPVREEDSNDSSASLIRHRSMLPPGLATRTSPDEDILRRQEDVPVLKKLKKSKRDLHAALKEAPSHSDLAALDLADEAADPRAVTPSEPGETPMGLYRYGTLRITNGAASPVPSIATSTTKSLELSIPPLPNIVEKTYRAFVGNKDRQDQRASLDYHTAPNTPQDRESMEYYAARTSIRDSAGMYDAARSPQQASFGRHSDGERRSRERTRPSITQQKSRDTLVSSGIPIPLEVDESSPRIYRPSRPHRSKTSSQTFVPQIREPSLPARSRDSSLSRIPLRLEPPRQGLRRLETQVSAISLTPVRPEIDDGRISPIPSDLPRFAQRWSHRASKLGEDYTSDSDASNYGDVSTLRQYESHSALLKRLSTVFDGGDEDTTAHETPDAALSKLSGVDRDAELTIETQLTSLNNERPGQSPRSGNSNSLDRPTPANATDSGYATDSSFRATQTKKSLEQQPQPKRVTQMFMVPDEAVSNEQDGVSLYSFNQILKSPSLLQTFSTPSPPVTNAKKRPSLFRLSTSKKSSATTLVDTVASEEGMRSSPPPMDTKGVKQKKLQKPMPESVRKDQKKRREDKRNSEMLETTIAGPPYEIPPPATELSDRNRQRFSFEPIPMPVFTVDSTPIVATPNELPTDVHQTTAELNANDGFASADEPPAISKPSRSRSRSKRRSTGRPRSLGAEAQSEGNKPDESTPSDVSRDNEGVSKTPKPSIFGVGTISCISRPDEESEVLPLWTDHASVSRSLGCSPYDISTGMMKRTVALPSTVMHQIQAPHEITTSLSRSKTGGLKGMDSGMASELARLKSRDVAINKNEEVYDRPRMAKPRTRKSKSSDGQSSARVPLLLEDRFPGLEESVETDVTPSLAELPTRSMSMYSESIPPMPELPADVHKKVTRIDQMAARRQKENVRPKPTPIQSDERSSDERPGDSTLSVADAIRRARSPGRSPELNESEEGIQVARTRPPGPRKKKSQRIERENSSSGSDGTITDRQLITQRQEDDLAPVTDSKPSDRSSLEQQAKHWQEQRRSAERALGKSKSEDNVVLHTTTTTTVAPTIVVSTHIATQGTGTRTQSQTHTQTQVHTETTETFAHQRQRTDSASLQADAYRALIGDNRTPTPNPEEQEEFVTYRAATSVTVHRLTEQRPATVTVPAHSPSSSRSAILSASEAPFSSSPSTISPPEVPIGRSRSPGGRVITPSGNYHPYTPADAAQAQRSRAESLAKLTGTDMPAPKRASTAPAPPRQSTPKQPSRKQAGQPPTPKQPSPKKAHTNAIEALFDRYSGGLEYNYERGVGFGGSAGTRSSRDWSGRKSKELSEGWGVDLSDVPFVLQKVGKA